MVLYLDRPAVIPEIAGAAKALLAEYGASDAAVLDVIFGRAAPEGRLPFELPRSMEAVRAQKPDVPYDSEDPLYPFGFGLSFEVEPRPSSSRPPHPEDHRPTLAFAVSAPTGRCVE